MAYTDFVLASLEGLFSAPKAPAMSWATMVASTVHFSGGSSV